VFPPIAVVVAPRSTCADNGNHSRATQAGCAAGALIVSDVAGVTNVHDPIVKFATTHFAELKAFAETAYANASLQWLWDALSKFSDKL
jgi:hypothetical protein